MKLYGASLTEGFFGDRKELACHVAGSCTLIDLEILSTGACRILGRPFYLLDKVQ